MNGPCGTSEDSKPMISSARLPSRPAARCASTGSSSRRFAGHSFACTTLARGVIACPPRVERDTGGGAEDRPLLNAHPRFGDDAERTFAAEHDAGPGSGPRRCRAAVAIPTSPPASASASIRRSRRCGCGSSRSDRRSASRSSRRASTTENSAENAAACSRRGRR